MDPDIIFVLGLGIFALTIPAVINAFSTSGATLRPAALFVLVGGTMVVWANFQTPGGYSITQVPSIIADLFR